jgi:GNAT superfamily N-acetyltransferase
MARGVQLGDMTTADALPAFRRATTEDIPALSILIALSARALSVGEYAPAQVEAALKGAFGVDTGLIADGTYWMAEHAGEPVACGGWSKRKALFGADSYHGASSEQLDPETEPARIRAFFVHPDWARRGLGRKLLDLCEAEARAAGFKALELMATRPGLKLYLASGYIPREPRIYDLGGVEIDFIPMGKALA